MIEIGTRVCADVGEAREELVRLRGALAEIADDHKLAVVAVAGHPFGDAEAQSTGPRRRYDDIARDIGGLARRLMTCGMHVHVGLGDDDELRIDLMRQFAWFLPMVLALSASSPFSGGEDTELASWRTSLADTMPALGPAARLRELGGLPQVGRRAGQAGIIEDASKIWWDMRPSEAWPTLEVRIADVMPRLDDALAVAAFVQAVPADAVAAQAAPHALARVRPVLWSARTAGGRSATGPRRS